MTGFICDPSFEAGDIPATYTLAMYPVESVGGIVRDEQGRPIEGVLVEPMTWMRSVLTELTVRSSIAQRLSGPTLRAAGDVRTCRRVSTRRESRFDFLMGITNESTYPSTRHRSSSRLVRSLFCREA